MTRTIKLDHICKIEGHASLTLSIDKGRLKRCELGATEGARYFEGIVRGRKYNEAHELTSRICGICSSAHVVCALHAIEDALGMKTSRQTEDLRVLLTLAERIRSHATHLYFLALPDYLGYESALAMAPKFKKELQQALRIMKTGNRLNALLAGRDLHPVSATVGGWLKLPRTEELRSMAKELKAVKKDAIATCRLFFSLEQPTMETESEFFSLKDRKGFAVLRGDFTSAQASFPKEQYLDFIREYHRPYSTANFVVKDEKRYMVGALARFNNNGEQLSPSARKMLRESGIALPSRNPFINNLCQAIEIVHCIDHAIDLCATITIKQEKPKKARVRAGRGVGCIEVPRGTLWHDYTLDEQGIIINANIITPTAQNLLSAQEDIRTFVSGHLDMKKDELIMAVEKLIRAYDPCFSCSAHFLEVKWE
ncbi:MAG: Ni/Fe hydrogenase subunit alpha [DPANN group archaeon]|nr:Ni/Fe hydrogenase subunit alpha [DPANN group archaeon]